MKFIFDLDGTVTLEETLPLISNHFNIDKQINELTQETINGNIPFIESFIRRVQILGSLPVSEINDLLSNVSLSKKIYQFIQDNKDDCIIATGNLDIWVEKLIKKIACKAYCSDCIVKDNKVEKITHILKKEDIVKKYKDRGEQVVFIGDGNNDVEAMRDADIAIACGIVHYPAKSVLSVADYVVFSENSLSRLLNQIKEPQKGKSLILSCAGIGSRLGLGKTKALIEIEDKPLIYWQLEQFKGINDIRIVIGYQANDIIKTVLKFDKDVIFVYNHDYFHTKTGASYYLGSRHGNEYSIAWDGDLLVHPDDVQSCLNFDNEYIGCSETITDDAVLVSVSEKGEVLRFSIGYGKYEWSGPACLKKEHIKFTSGHVYHQIEEHLPLPAMVIRAQDIDTYDDYKKAIEFIKTWK